jgi:hypothetical protein
MFNYMKYFDFVTTIFKNHMFKVGLYIFIKITCRCNNLQNRGNSNTSRLNIGSILFLSQWHVKYISGR